MCACNIFLSASDLSIQHFVQSVHMTAGERPVPPQPLHFYPLERTSPSVVLVSFGLYMFRERSLKSAMRPVDHAFRSVWDH